jgi:hypothetical protein
MTTNNKQPRAVTPDEMMKLRRERITEMFASSSIDPAVSFVFQGKTYKMEFDNAGMKYVMSTTGHNILTDGMRDEHFGDPNILGAVVHAGLMIHHPEITLEAVDRMLNPRFFPFFMSKVIESLKWFMPDMSDVVVPDETKPVEGELVDTDPIVH